MSNDEEPDAEIPPQKTIKTRKRSLPSGFTSVSAKANASKGDAATTAIPPGESEASTKRKRGVSKKTSKDEPFEEDDEREDRSSTKTRGKGIGKGAKGKMKTLEDESEPVVEKRLRRYRKAMPQALKIKFERAMQQRLYLVDRHRESDIKEIYKINGSTGNVYTVTVSNKVTCDCPDHTKTDDLCKHCLFVMVKVLGLSKDSPYIYQNALLTSELQEIFASARPDPTSIVPDSVKEAYEAMARGEEAPDPSGVMPRQPAEGDTCPICYEEFEKSETLVHCKNGCGNPLHAGCFSQWSSNCISKGTKVTCVYCRALWNRDSANSVPLEGYVNLASQLGISRQRDTSTYYHGPRKGGGWRWRRRYEDEGAIDQAGLSGGDESGGEYFDTEDYY
ncbi:hypothetical protein BZG36_00400 [Bifiguratus adelaidae]|uniref:SWIM-type domain-containing protein n=1 Tax=Bifiguratus adelaidae TaxID=1938954 RepID=A0A261Y857_9FUNG|nr:hypothetical protein BZG36_00400 [Bifiguratus adelaidae]